MNRKDGKVRKLMSVGIEKHKNGISRPPSCHKNLLYGRHSGTC